MISQEEVLERVLSRVSDKVAEAVKTTVAEAVQRELSSSMTKVMVESEFYRQLNEEMRHGLRGIYQEITNASDKEGTQEPGVDTNQTQKLFSDATKQLEEIMQTTLEATEKIMETVELLMTQQEEAGAIIATLTVPESWLDMVRVGGIFYGDTIASTEYKRVMTFKSAIASVNHYPKGNTVGYDRTYTLKRDSVLANIPTGYADGYRRVFSNAGHVLIRGQRVPVLGKTSMNTVIVDVTDLPQVASGDEVVLFGKQGNAQVSAEEVEEISGALFTEMSILWGATNKRVMVD